MDLDLTLRTDASDRSVIGLIGAVDLSTRELVLQAGRNAILASEGAGLVLDLGGVSFMDSTGLGMLVELNRLSAEQQVPLILRDPSPPVRRVLEITALDQSLQIEPAVERVD